MSKLVVSEVVTLDGVMEDPGGSEGFDRGGWAFRFERGPEGDKFKLDEALAADALLLGRKTYEIFASYWPSAGDFAIATHLNSVPKYVASTTLNSVEWNNSTLIEGDVPEGIARIKDQHNEVHVIGSAGLCP